MLAVDRRGRIVALLRAGSVSTDDLSCRLGVSAETVRRDLTALERGGALVRVHGGATLPALPAMGDEASFVDRATTATDAKRRIGAAAAALLQPGQTVMIDVGTTALAVARAIPPDFAGVVATCSLLVAIELADHRDLEVLVCGGRVRRGDLALSNALALDFFGGFHPDIAFLGSGGIDAVAGLTDFHLDEVRVRQSVLARSAQSWVLADTAKFGRVARHHVAGFDAVTGLVVDADPEDALAAAITAHGGQLRVAQ